MCTQNPVFITLSVVISQALLLGLVYFMVMAPSPSLPLQFHLFLDNPLFPGFFVNPSASHIYESWLGLALVSVLELCGLGCEASWSSALRLPSRFSLGPSPAAAQAQPVAPSFVPAAGVC